MQHTNRKKHTRRPRPRRRTAPCTAAATAAAAEAAPSAAAQAHTLAAWARPRAARAAGASTRGSHPGVVSPACATARPCPARRSRRARLVRERPLARATCTRCRRASIVVVVEEEDGIGGASRRCCRNCWNSRAELGQPRAWAAVKTDRRPSSPNLRSLKRYELVFLLRVCMSMSKHVHWCVSDRLSIGLLTDTRTEAQLVLRNRFVDTSRCGSHIQKLMPKECRGASKHAQAIDAALAPRRRNRRSEVRAAALFDAAASSASARATARRPHVAASALAKPRASLGRAALQLPWSRALTWSPSWCGSPSRRTPCRRHSAATAAAAPA